MDFLTLDILEINQPLETFYVAKISAKNLLKLCFTDPIRYEDGNLMGGQRILEESRIREIGQFISGVEAAFPNSVILSANFDEKGFNCEVDDPRRWKIIKEGTISKLVIPTDEKLASIIDGQHRIYGFKYVDEVHQEMELVCSIYLDLPNPYQAYLFATINSNQKKVDRSLAFEQFGFNIDNEAPISWSPDKLAIAISRKLNLEGSPFQGHIKIAPQIDEFLKERFKENTWMVSTATVVDALLRLISSNPKRDKYELQKVRLSDRKRSNLEYTDKSPLRSLYLDGDDDVIFVIIKNYFNAAVKILFNSAVVQSTIHRTVGIQALFDLLRHYIIHEIENGLELTEVDFSQAGFESFLSPLEGVDFSNSFYQFSGVGKSRILNTLLIATNLGVKSKFKVDDLEIIRQILHH